MKNFALLFMLFVLLSSCRLQRPVRGREPDTSKKFVQLENGTTLSLNRVEMKPKRIVTDSGIFAKRDVRAFGDGYDNYLRRRKGTFLTQEYAGKINVYSIRQTTANMGRYASSTPLYLSTQMRKYWYIQPEGTNYAMKLSYRNLKNAIPKKDDAYAYLVSYARNRRINRLMKVASVGLFLGGLTAEGIGDDLRGGMMFTSAPLFAFAFVRGPFTRLKIDFALAKYNGVLKP